MNLLKLLFFIIGLMFCGAAFSQSVQENKIVPLNRSQAELIGYTDTLFNYIYFSKEQKIPLNRREAELMGYKDTLSGYQYTHINMMTFTRKESELMGLQDTLQTK
jgi:hypothetical protein